MKTKNGFIKLFLFSAILIVSSCETVDLDQTVDPSGVSPELLNTTFAFNNVQLQLADFVNSSNDFTQRVTRQMAMTGGNTYDNAFAPVNFDDNWNTAYRLLNAIKVMEPKAIQNNENYALGASKVIRAYVLMTLADMYGDIPLTEALQGAGNLTPKFDKSADVYKQVLIDLDDAIATLNLTNNTKTTIQDLYYQDQAHWIILANTLKLKLYNNARLAGSDIGISDVGSAMMTIINSGQYIKTADQDFAFKYGNSQDTPNTRHPSYNDQYGLNGGAYIGNYMMWAMTTEKYGTGTGSTTFTSPAITIYDPRIQFYFFKQYTNPADFNDDSFTLPGRSRPPHYDDPQYASFFDATIHTPYVVSNWVGGTSVAANGFWGRDHGDNSGIPPDADKRTVGGIYPIGGSYGTFDNVQTGGNKGALGAGIMPIVMSSFVHFIIAEASLTVPGVSANARSEFQIGMEQSIDKTIGFIPDYKPSSRPTVAALQTPRNTYVNFMLNKFDGLNSAKQLELIIKEYYIAAWGNGVEPYNNYRRTGYPSNFQPTREENSGAFYYTAYYPAVSVNNNPNTPANNRTRKVFWDKSNLNLH